MRKSKHKFCLRRVLRKTLSAALALVMAAGGACSAEILGGITEVQAATRTAPVTRGARNKYSTDGLGSSYSTFTYYTNLTYGGDHAKSKAICLQPSKSAPKEGTYEVEWLPDNSKLAKVMYYGTNYAGNDSYFESNEYNTLMQSNHWSELSDSGKWVVMHLACSYANNTKSNDWKKGANSKGQTIAQNLYDWAIGKPELPDADIWFQMDGEEVKKPLSEKNGKVFKKKALGTNSGDDYYTSAVFSIRANNKDADVNVTVPPRTWMCEVEHKGDKWNDLKSTIVKSGGKGKTVALSPSKFYRIQFHGDATKVDKVKLTMKPTREASYNFKGAKLHPKNNRLQYLGTVMPVPDDDYASMTMEIGVEYGAKIKKTNSETGDAVAGAVYGIYTDRACDEDDLLVKLPETNSKGEAESDVLNWDGGKLYAQEIKAPDGMALNTKIYTLDDDETKATTKDGKQIRQYSFEVADSPIYTLRVYKKGKVFTGATPKSDGTGVTLKWESKNIPLAHFAVYGTDKKGNKDEDQYIDEASASSKRNYAEFELDNPGTYYVEETAAPEGYALNTEGKKVSITKKDFNETAEVYLESTTITDEKQKALINVIKVSQDGNKPLNGATFGLYAGQDIKTYDGKSVAIKKDTLIETKKTSGTGDKTGTATFSSLLPDGNYYVKEIAPPPGYSLSGIRSLDGTLQPQVWEFTVEYKGEDLKEYSVSGDSPYKFANYELYGSVTINKRERDEYNLDHASGKQPQGDASLVGAVYGLYAAENIVKPDGTGTVVYKKIRK